MSFLFGKKDPALATVARFREEFTDASVVELPEAGHYIREDDPDACADATSEVLAAS